MHDCTVLQCANAPRETRAVVLSARMVDEAQNAKEFIERALAATGLKPYGLARKAGIAPSTITRFLNNPNFKFIPKQATLNRIAEAAGLTAPTVAEPSLMLEPVRQWVPLVGEARAGVWTEIPAEPVIEDHIAVHLPEYRRAQLFALRVSGKSMDQKYADGTIVIVAPAAEAGIRVGDDVVVRRHRNGLAETTLKEVTQNGDGGFELAPRSSDASFTVMPFPARSRNWMIDDAHQDGTEIIGVVLHSISPSRRGRGPLVTYSED